jgi:hypothetical protein
MPEDDPHNAALMVGLIYTSNLQTEISQTPVLLEFYSKPVKTVYEAPLCYLPGDICIVLSFIYQKINVQSSNG